MSQLGRVWMAATVAVANGHTDRGHKLKSATKSLQHGRNRLSSSSSTSSASGGDVANLRPLSAVLGLDLGGFLGTGTGQERPKQADDSFRNVMYLSSWVQG